MVFSSITFLCFFLPAVIICYFMFKNPRHRNGVLILASLFFYTWGATKWIVVMVFTVAVNYLCGLGISKTDRNGLKRLYMLIGVILGIGFLVYFKYSGFLVTNIAGLFGVETGYKTPVLPIGISFYTFQVLTYTIDVYKGKVDVQKSFWKLLLYVSFFPQLIAGPIVNYKDISAYLEKRKVRYYTFFPGFERFFIGFAKKVMLANLCGELSTSVGMTGEMSVLGAWIGAVAYSFQIYFDFSGYSDMAIGMGKMFGFNFLENFNYPYISTSCTEFWRRWHMSLGSFFREYVYIPLGGNRVSKAKNIRNIMVVWALTGIWHGASWNFLLWGLYYGVLLIIEKQLIAKFREKIPTVINYIVTMVLVIVGWVIFYHTNLPDIGNQLAAMFGIKATGFTDAAAIYYGKRYLGFLIVSALACIPWKNVLLKIPFINRRSEELSSSMALTILKALAVTALTVISVGLLVGQSYNPFLYFRF